MLELSSISKLFDHRFEIAGCFLVPRAEAERRVGESQVVYESVRNGKGPAAWNHHWLVVPLHGAEGELTGLASAIVGLHRFRRAAVLERYDRAVLRRDPQELAKAR